MKMIYEKLIYILNIFKQFKFYFKFIKKKKKFFNINLFIMKILFSID